MWGGRREQCLVLLAWGEEGGGELAPGWLTVLGLSSAVAAFVEHGSPRWIKEECMCGGGGWRGGRWRGRVVEWWSREEMEAITTGYYVVACIIMYTPPPPPPPHTHTHAHHTHTPE